MLVMSLVSNSPYRSASELGPVQHQTDGSASRAFENNDTARLALAQFPLPVEEDANGTETSKLIKSVQIELSRHGLDTGPVDGISSPKTREAIAVYQRQMGFEITGQPSRLLLDHLSLTEPLRAASATPESGEMVRLVKKVQRQLGNLGYKAGKLTGIVTGQTRNAIAKFERDTGLPVTGEVSFKLVQRLQTIDYTPL